jgi:hypothetical protein
VDSIDDLRSELQRAGETLLESLRPEFQELRKAIVNDIAMELRQSSRKKIRRRTDPRKEAIARLLQEHPEITNLQICREMDKLQDKSTDYTPPRSWPCRLWWESYLQVGNRVHSYISSIRRSLR